MSHTLDSLFRNVILDEMRRIINAGALYLSYANVAVGVELLGACQDPHPYDEEGKSRQRFETGLKTYMATVRPAYNNPAFFGRNSRYDLYKHLRCGMAHILRPQGKVGIIGRGNAQQVGWSHLDIYTPRDQVIFTSEDFFEDFEKATNLLLADIAGSTNPKHTGVFLPVTPMVVKGAPPEASAPIPKEKFKSVIVPRAKDLRVALHRSPIPAQIGRHIGNEAECATLVAHAEAQKLEWRALLAFRWNLVDGKEARMLLKRQSHQMIDIAVGILGRGQKLDHSAKDKIRERVFNPKIHTTPKKKVQPKQFNKKRKIAAGRDSISEDDLYAHGYRQPGSYGSRQ
jgi:hypothetical protein